MTLVHKDSFQLMSAVVLLCGEIALLLYLNELAPFPLFKPSVAEKAGIAGVVNAQGLAHRRPQSERSWYPLSEGSRLHPGDWVMTGGTSTAKMIWGTGAHITLQDHALIAIGSPRFRVLRGVVVVTTQASELEMDVGTRLIHLNANSEILISVSPFDYRERLQVRQGSAEIPYPEASSFDDATPKKSILREGDVTQFGAQREPAKILTHLNIAPLYPQAGMKVMSVGLSQLASFKWTGDLADTVELDRTSDFPSPVSFPAKDRQASIALGAGKYFWRTAKGDLVSRPYDFTVMPMVTYHPGKLESPPTDLNPFKLSWETIGEASGYDLQVSRDNTFRDPFLTKNTPKPEIELALQTGNYFWRVRGVHPTLGDWPYSDSYPLTVVKAKKPNKKRK